MAARKSLRNCDISCHLLRKGRPTQLVKWEKAEAWEEINNNIHQWQSQNFRFEKARRFTKELGESLRGEVRVLRDVGRINRSCCHRSCTTDCWDLSSRAASFQETPRRMSQWTVQGWLLVKKASRSFSVFDALHRSSLPLSLWLTIIISCTQV